MSGALSQLPKTKRPRERLLATGAHNLTMAELLAIILSSGTSKRNVLSMSRKIMTKFGQHLAKVTLKDLTTIYGIGPIQGGKIIAALELGKRSFSHIPKPRLLKPQDVLREVTEIRTSQREQLIGLYLNARYELLAKEVLAVGTTNTQQVEARDVYSSALKLPSRGLILVHNHPSGDPQPSQNDLITTRRLKQAGKILGINLLDHLIVTQKNYLSFQGAKLL